jgi:hypothetical protein
MREAQSNKRSAIVFLHFPAKDQGTTPRKEKKNKKKSPDAAGDASTMREAQRTFSHDLLFHSLHLPNNQTTQAQCAKREIFFLEHFHIHMYDSQPESEARFVFLFLSQCASTETSKKNAMTLREAQKKIFSAFSFFFTVSINRKQKKNAMTLREAQKKILGAFSSLSLLASTENSKKMQ